MRGRLVVCFDGTWNTAEDQTNVSRLYAAIADRDVGCRGQLKFYDEGVGTKFGDRVRGGTLGRGLDVNILQGYCWLVNNYHQKGENWKEESRYGEDPVEGPDELFLFGFSRGAFTARSLGGMVNRCGILKKDLFRERVGRRLVTPDDPIVQEAWSLYRAKIEAPPYANATTRDAPECVDFRRKYSCPDDGLAIKFLGVWDTVGALGVPVSHVPFSRDYYRWHDTELSKIVDYACHAIAVDENRKDYDVAVWTRRKPENLEVEQRWFVGAHANVGGGYPDDPLHTRPLRWMQDKAEAAGLALRGKAEVGARDHLADINDSFREFMYGAYRLVKERYWRSFGRGVNESVDEGVWRRWKEKPEYRPETLARHPEKPAG